MIDPYTGNKLVLKQLKNASLKNAVKTGHEAGKAGAQNAGVTALTISGIMNVVSVIKGEE